MDIIQVKDLVKNFKEIKAVCGLSFSVKEGEIFALLGPNGAGKSTTIKILTTLLPPTAGQVIINGFDVEHDPDDVRKSFGIVFQDPSLDEELTAYENMSFHAALYGVPAKERKSRIEQLLKIVELWDRKNDLVKTFSGGMKRRLEIARGLLHHPKIFFLDEPTVGLDPQTRNHIWDYVLKLNQQEKVTVMFTTHYMDEAEKVANRVAIIDHGNLVALGTPQELKTEAQTQSLEEAFLHFTGYDIRDEQANNLDDMRMRHNHKR
ncbi:MAG TPA: ATP-binding cassette domain-containing protein [Candidatus Paceibacterota bacterium]|nr:ATP-binding cassette domain-containing protein [Candidatus Paceibacterota bacterium]